MEKIIEIIETIIKMIIWFFVRYIGYIIEGFILLSPFLLIAFLYYIYKEHLFNIVKTLKRKNVGIYILQGLILISPLLLIVFLFYKFKGLFNFMWKIISNFAFGFLGGIGTLIIVVLIVFLIGGLLELLKGKKRMM
jgi:hypothetical protein